MRWPSALTGTLQSAAFIPLLALALEGSLGIEAIGMEAARVGIRSTFIYIWKCEQSQESSCGNSTCWKTIPWTWVTPGPTTPPSQRTLCGQGTEKRWGCLMPWPKSRALLAAWYGGRVSAAHLPHRNLLFCLSMLLTSLSCSGLIA